jgi:hypothetical protein
MGVVVTNAGEEYVVDKLKESVSTEANYIGWGTGAGTAAKTDTDLFTPVNSDPGNVTRILGTSSKVGTGASAKYQVVATLQSIAGGTITNAGMWTAISGGTLFVHGDHAGVLLVPADQIQYTFTVDPS